MAASLSRPGKRTMISRREVDPFGWFSDDEQRTDYIYKWGFKEIIRHKYLNVSFYCQEGFKFNDWLEKNGVSKFVEMQGDCYPNLVKVFYCNLKRDGSSLKLRVKGVDVVINQSIWENVAGLQQEGILSHQGMIGFNCKNMYKCLLRNPSSTNNIEEFSIKNLLMDECLCAYVITWILLPREHDQSIMNEEDLSLICALFSVTHVNWPFTICDHMMKFTKRKGLCLSYRVFISKVLQLHRMDLTNEGVIHCNKNNLMRTRFLNSVGIIKLRDEWTMINDISSTFDVNPQNIYASRYKFRPFSTFEGHVDRRFDRMDNKLILMQKSLSDLHKKMDYALRIRAFEESFIGDTDSGINSAAKKIEESS